MALDTGKEKQAVEEKREGRKKSVILATRPSRKVL